MNNESLKTSGRIIHTSIGAVPTQLDNEWQNIVDSWIFDFSDDGKASMKTGENTYVPYPNDFIKAFISSILLKQKASLKQKMIKKVATYLISDIEGGRLDVIHTNNATVSAILSALNEID